MAEEAETKNSKKIIAIVAGAILVVAAIIVTIVLINRNNSTLNDDFFKTSDSKVVISTTTTGTTDSSVAKKVHQVYTIDGDKVTGLKVYSEFDSEESAKTADSKPEVEEGVKSGQYVDHKVEGKYLIVTMPESMYQSLTAEQIKATAAALEEAQKSTEQQSQTESETETKTQSTETQTTENQTQPIEETTSSNTAKESEE